MSSNKKSTNSKKPLLKSIIDLKKLNDSNLNVIALGDKTINIPKLITTLLHKYNCKFLHSNILELNEDLALSCSINGKWNEIAKLEKALSNLNNKFPIHIYIKRANHANKIIHPTDASLLSSPTPTPTPPMINYLIQATALNTSVLFEKLFDFFDQYKIPIKSAKMNVHAHDTNLITFELQLKISTDVHLMTLRENFLNLCDNLNLDTNLEPL